MKNDKRLFYTSGRSTIKKNNLPALKTFIERRRWIVCKTLKRLWL